MALGMKFVDENFFRWFSIRGGQSSGRTGTLVVVDFCRWLELSSFVGQKEGGEFDFGVAVNLAINPAVNLAVNPAVNPLLRFLLKSLMMGVIRNGRTHD